MITRKADSHHVLTRLAIAAFVLGITARVLGIYNDFWLDEIWSYNIAQGASSLSTAIFSADENSHPLNTLFMFMLGNQRSWWVYRIPALIASLCTLLIVYRASYPLKGWHGPSLLLFFSLSYPMILYGSEARGYSLMILFMLLSWSCLRSFLKLNAPSSAACFNVSVILGLLSHPAFVQYYAAAFAWSFVAHGHPHRAKRASTFFSLHLLPSLFLSLYYLTLLKNLHPGAGNIYGFADLFTNTFAMAFSAPLVSPHAMLRTLGSFLLAIGLFASFTIELYRLRREGDRIWLFYLLVIFVLPVATVVLSHRETIEPRYFLPSIVFSYFLAAGIVQRAASLGVRGRLCAAAVLGLFSIGSCVYIGEFLLYGRGQYLAALTYVERNSPKGPIEIGSDFDFRNGMIVSFYRRYLENDFIYTPKERRPAPLWYIKASQDSAFDPPSSFCMDTGRCYAFAKSFPYTAGSGCAWHLYKRD